jgi:hypothetical protein
MRRKLSPQEERLQSFRREIEFLETNPDSKQQLEMLKRWNRLTLDQQEEISREWNLYYTKVRQTKKYKLFQQQKSAYLKHDMGTVKELIGQIKSLPNELDSPEFPDPELIINNQNTARYMFLKNSITNLEKEIAWETNNPLDM